MKPLAITMGCPVGIGPEIILKFFALRSYSLAGFPTVVVADPAVLRWCGQQVGISMDITEWAPGDAIEPDVVPVLRPKHLIDLPIERLAWGEPDKNTGKAMACCIEEAVQLIGRGIFSGMVTCPITKKALKEAGYSFPGHTEMLASLCNCDAYAMMMAGTKLRVTLVTIHTPLASVSSKLTSEKIYNLILLTAKSLKNDFGISTPHIAVAALNPHAGEEGMFGDEEKRLIAPAIQRAACDGLRISGPYPSDTVFFKAVSSGFDAVVCMYHDQGLIPFKLLHFKDGVNVTIGLPIVRTSVDHGTAYDIAGQGKADPASLFEAVKMAGEIVVNRSRVTA